MKENKIYLYIKTWYQETPDYYYNELIGKFDSFSECTTFLDLKMNTLEDNYPIVEVKITRNELEHKIKLTLTNSIWRIFQRKKKN